MQKYKNIILNILISICFLIATFILIGQVYALTVDYVPKNQEEFMNATADSLLGKNMYMGGGLWVQLQSAGQVGCFHHLGPGTMSNTIHSVYDIGFDDDRGVIKIYSTMNVANSKPKNAYADEDGPTVGRLAAEASQPSNATGVQRALAAAIKAGTVVKDTAIGLEEQHVDSVNPASSTKINLYNNYRQMKKAEGKKAPEEKNEEVTIKREKYTIVGPFKMTFAGTGIQSVAASGAKWTPKSTNEIYWCTKNSTEASDWSNNFNKKTTGKYVLDGKSFYLAIKTSKLADGGKYNVIIKQEKFEYSKARIVFCLSANVGQQSGLYAYDNTPIAKTGEVSWNIKRNGLKTLSISKVDEKTGQELTGAGFKIYAELTDGTKGWVSGDVAATKTYGNNATEYASKTNINNLKNGTYYIYETTAPDNCILSEQTGYHQAANGSNDLAGDWVFIGTQTLTQNSGGKVTFTATNKPLAATEIIKKDMTTGQVLTGGKFKLYAVLNDGTRGWISGEASGNKSYGDAQGEYASSTKIEKLKYGTYYIYETEAPGGYNITKQTGYHQASEGSSSLTGDWAYLGNQIIDINFPADGVFKFEAVNKKVVEGIEGDVWVDNPQHKNNIINHIHDSGDGAKAGIPVVLYNSENQVLATTTTDSNGHYEIKNKNAISGEDKDIYYGDLEGAWIGFAYNNKTIYNEDGTVKEYGYVVVNPYTGTDAKVNSKAQEWTMTKEKLDDNKLTGIDQNSANPGMAVTNRTDIKYYYDESTYKVSNINLGLIEKHDADYDLQENLAYIKVNMKGYTYTYKYGDSPVSTSTNVPTVEEQNSTKSYGGKIYPSDIVYNIANQTDELKVYVVYSIDVTNNETMYLDDLYTEERLYLDSLVNTYDTNRYELCTNENNSDKSDFALWRDKGNGKASYDVNNENSVYRNGMAKQEKKTSYIQFRIKEEALRRILQDRVTDGELENAPTVATASAYHEYLRTDNVWVHDENVRAFEGAKGVNIYPITSDNNKKKYYVHKTISKNKKSSDLYLKLSLGEQRKISGTVFEDTKTEQSENDKTNLGNGRIDVYEENTAQNVTVELLDTDKETPTKLYKENNGQIVYNSDGKLPDAITTTQVGGTYEFDGVVPGYYYIRFTYGDGKQKIMPAETKITSNDYKSTIINTEPNGAGDTIKNAMEAKTEDLNIIRETSVSKQTEAQRKIVEWYKYLNDKNYSTAVDDLQQRAKFDKYKYGDDGKVYDESGNVVTDYSTNINAYTPMTSISIENDTNISTDEGDIHKPNYDGFNFGLIEQPKTEIRLDKKITNIKLTAQTGTTIVSANPTDKSAINLSALDNITGGSKNASMEIDQSLIYGSSLETTYEISIENESDIEYIEEEGSNDYGKYYYYGERSSTSKLKTVKVEEIVDELDKKYNYTKQENTIANLIHSDGNTETVNVSITQNNPDGSTETTNSIKMTGWKEFESGATETLSYAVTSLLSKDDDTAYVNNAKVTLISLDKLTSLKSNFEWKLAQDDTVFTITPPTGSDKRPIYWIAGTIGLIVLAIGIVFIKKKALKK